MGIVEPLTPATFADDAALAEIHFGEASGHDVETIDGLLEKGSWFNTWPQNLRDTYLVGTEQRLYREHGFLLLLGLGICLGTIVIDALTNPALVQEGLLARLVIGVPLAILGYVGGRMRNSALVKFALIASPSAFCVLVTHLSLHQPPEIAAQYVMAISIWNINNCITCSWG